MSETSRDLEDGGDRNQDCNTSNVTRRAPIRFLDARTCDLKITMPRALAERADQGGKHRDNLRYELALLWRRYTQDGEFRVSMRMFDELHTAHFRKELKAILDDAATPVRTHSNYAASARSRSYKFKFRRPKKTPTYGAIPEEPDGRLSLLPPDLVHVTIPSKWLRDRYERWSDICKRNDWTSSLDLDGRTEWGRPLFAALELLKIPDTPETSRLTTRGVVKAAKRKRGRCYHPITNLRKDLRRNSLIDDEPTVEVDIHACYTALLISKLRDGPAKRRAIEAIRSGWYVQFDSAYAEWFGRQCEIGNGYVGNDGQWMVRLDDDPKHDAPASIKVEYQRQCLFWRDGRDASNPLRTELRRLHPELCMLIERWRKRLSPTKLSDVLTHAEGALVVDYAVAELERAGIAPITIHDAVMVQASRADEARIILLGVCKLHLGFQPKVSTKASEIARTKLLTL